jgi:hypothetical protein
MTTTPFTCTVCASGYHDDGTGSVCIVDGTVKGAAANCATGYTDASVLNLCALDTTSDACKIGGSLGILSALCASLI